MFGFVYLGGTLRLKDWFNCTHEFGVVKDSKHNDMK